MEHLRLNGAYWGLTTLDMLGKLNVVDQDEVVSWVMQCQHESGLCYMVTCYNIVDFGLNLFIYFSVKNVCLLISMGLSGRTYEFFCSWLIGTKGGHNYLTDP